MTVDLSSYKVVNNELSSSTKFDNLVQAIQDALNALPPSQLVGYPSDATKFLRGDGSWAVPPVVLATLKKGTTKDVVNTVAETDLLNGEITIPGGLVAAGSFIRLDIEGDYLNNSGGAQGITVRVKVGGTTIWGNNLGAAAFAADVDRRFFQIQVTLAFQAANSWNLRVNGFFGDAGTPSVAGVNTNAGGPGIYGSSVGLQTADFATSKLIEVTIVHSAANASLSMRTLGALVEILP